MMVIADDDGYRRRWWLSQGMMVSNPFMSGLITIIPFLSKPIAIGLTVYNPIL